MTKFYAEEQNSMYLHGSGEHDNVIAKILNFSYVNLSQGGIDSFVAQTANYNTILIKDGVVNILSGQANSINVQGNIAVNLGQSANNNVYLNLESATTANVYAADYNTQNFIISASDSYSAIWQSENDLKLQIYDAIGNLKSECNFYGANIYNNSPRILGNMACSPVLGETSEPESAPTLDEVCQPAEPAISVPEEVPTLEPIELGTPSILVGPTESMIDTPKVEPTAIF